MDRHEDLVSMSFARLVTAAMLGTESGPRPPSAPAADEPGDLASRFPASSGEETLLIEAAVRWTWERAGRRPVREAGLETGMAPEEDLPEAGAAAGSLLGRMLLGEMEFLLDEWLEGAKRCGVRIPAEHLPAVLDRSAKDRRLRGRIETVCGERGRWLLGQNPEWSSVLEPEPDSGDWETGDISRRVVALRRWRLSDPESARAALETSWPKEAADDRTALLEELVVAPVPSDAVFLESLLRDRRREVRRLAERGLAKLPGSGYAERMADRARRCLSFDAGRIEAVPPVACDAGMVRDGVETRPPAATGERAWWMLQVLAAAPLGTWERETGLTPEALVDGAAGEWREQILDGWTQAAIRQGNPAWAEAVLSRRFGSLEPSALRPLARCLPVPRRETSILRMLDAGNGTGWDLADDLGHSWSVAFSRRMLRLLRLETSKPMGDWELRNRFGRFAARLHPDTFPEVPAGWPESAHDGGFWASGLDAMTSVVAFRQQILSAFPPLFPATHSVPRT